MTGMGQAGSESESGSSVDKMGEPRLFPGSPAAEMG